MGDQDAREIVGELEWEMSERPHRRTAGRGRLTICRQDIKVVPLAERTAEALRRSCVLRAIGCPLHVRNLHRKQINVIGDISIGIADGPEGRYDKLGFSMWASREAVRTFSWDWFRLAGADRAKEIQKGGELAIRLVARPTGWEIGYTEFLTDVSLRMGPAPTTWRRLLEDLRDGPVWRIRILKGSRVEWPPAG